MKHLRASPVVKGIALVLAVIFLTGAFWSTSLTIDQGGRLWSEDGYYGSGAYHQALNDKRNQLSKLLHLTYQAKHDGSLSYMDHRQMEELTAALTTQNSNFRYRILRNSTGAEVMSNVPAGTVEEQVYRVHHFSMHFELEGSATLDYTTWSPDTQSFIVTVDTADGLRTFSSATRVEAAQYGWTDNGSDWDYDADQDLRNPDSEYIIECGVTTPLVAQDAFWEGEREYGLYSSYLSIVPIVALALCIAAVLTLVLLGACAGHRRGVEGISLTGLHRVPTDLFWGLDMGFMICIAAIGVELFVQFNQDTTPEFYVSLGILSCIASLCAVALFVTCVARIKGHTFFRNTLVCRFFRRIVRLCREITAHWPVTRRMVCLFLLYLLGSALTAFTLILIPFYQGFVLWCLCRWMRQWRAVREGTQHLVGGNPDHRINTDKMYRDLKEHAVQLNDMGSAISSAVDERMKSERFKTELITNVSHDLKTPLTSIINYVDLLKKEAIDNPRATEYIEVLDRKSQRLKKLTEDLVDASKASTGSLSVTRERLDMAQLLQQGIGEFSEKFALKHLDLVSTLPSTPLWVEADGRHLWRILDNLLSNCHKYALEHTRIYLDLSHALGVVTLSVKNISSQPLNIPPEQLMERFVRGEESRSTDGSGLGLSIARSLTSLQGGTFQITIDGDLFKAALTLPEAAPPQ